MDFDYSPRQKDLIRRVSDFMDEHIYPAVPIYEEQAQASGERWKVIPIVEELKAKARKTGLWNMFMPPHSGVPHVDDTFQFEGVQLTNLEYAPICEMFGRVGFASEVFNCSAPGHRQHGGAEPLRHARAEGALAAPADERRDPLGLPDDRAPGRLLRRHQHRDPHGARRRRLCASTAASGGRPASAIRAARSPSSWARPTPTPRRTSSSRRSWCRSTRPG